MALKKRTLVSPSAGAVSLPSLMADLPGTRRLEEVPLDKLSPAPAAWNFYAPLPDDKLLEQRPVPPHRRVEAAGRCADDSLRPQPRAGL